MRILAIDPGTTQSAWVLYEYISKEIITFGLEDNEQLREKLIEKYRWRKSETILAVEMIASYGRPVGQTVFETCVWIGRFIESWEGNWEYVYRKDVKMHLCNSMRGVNDAVIIRRLKDIFEPELEGAKRPKKALKGITKDVWQALAVAVTYAETRI